MAECCGMPMIKRHPHSQTGKQQWQCAICSRWTINPAAPVPSRLRLRLVKITPAPEVGPGWKVQHGASGYVLHQRKSDSRWSVYLGRDHPYANGSGQQLLYRFLVMDKLGRRLSFEEHVHHIRQDHKSLEGCFDFTGLELVLAEYHGSLHAWHHTLATPSQLSQGIEEGDSEAVALSSREVPRWRAIIGASAAV